MPKIIPSHDRKALPLDDPTPESSDDTQNLELHPRAWENRHATAQAYRASEARVASKRRRSVDPCTSDLDYSPDELEFMLAMQAYKQSSGRIYPTWSEVLEVLTGLGYEKSLPASDRGRRN